MNSSNFPRVSFGAWASRSCSCVTFASCVSRRCNAPEARPVTLRRRSEPRRPRETFARLPIVADLERLSPGAASAGLKPPSGDVILGLGPRIQFSPRADAVNSKSVESRASQPVDPRDKPEDDSRGARRALRATTSAHRQYHRHPGAGRDPRKSPRVLGRSSALPAQAARPSQLLEKSVVMLAWVPASAGMTEDVTRALSRSHRSKMLPRTAPHFVEPCPRRMMSH